MRSNQRQERSMETMDYEYKAVAFQITVTPIQALGSQGYTWAAKIGGPIASGGEYYAHTASEAAAKARSAKEAEIDGRSKK
jgi:hypothetical protein